MTGQKIIDGLNEALNVARGDDQPAAVHVVHVRPMTMVERVRDAIGDTSEGVGHNSLRDQLLEQWAGCGAYPTLEDDVDMFLGHLARAAIEAMRAVEDMRAPMTEAMHYAFWNEYYAASQMHGHIESTNSAYRAMIDAALAEGEG